MRKLNSTGSYYYQDGNYWSYSTKLTDTYKGYKIYNGTRYSATTAKHQAALRYEYDYDIILTQCSYGNWDCKEMIQAEINHITRQIEQLQSKRNTQKKLQTLAELQEQLQFLSGLLDEQPEEQPEKSSDWLEEFQTLWNELSEENKQHVRNGLGDNLIQTEEQAKTLVATIKSMLMFQELGLL